MNCFFVTDLHGDSAKYDCLFKHIALERPDCVFIGGDLLSGGFLRGADYNENFIENVIAAGFTRLKEELGNAYPEVCIILGNDDPAYEEELVEYYGLRGLWHYVGQRQISLQGWNIFGYSFVPPTPFLNKDWERFDVSRFVDTGCVAPEEGRHTVPFSLFEAQYRTIKEDLEDLTGEQDLSRAIMLFHAPPYDTGLDRAALDGKIIDSVPLDVHVGSIAIRRFIEQKQPLISLHGHVHESYALTGVWKQKIGNTFCYSAAGKGKALTLVRFDTDEPHAASRSDLL